MITLTDVDPAAEAAALARDERMCVCCGRSVTGLPHRAFRRKSQHQGGDDSLSNLITFLGSGADPLDPDDHFARVNSRRDPSDEAKGYSLRSWQDPAAVPVKVMSQYGPGVTMLLTDDGARTPAPPEGLAA